jgi:inner membrane protein
MDSVTQAALGAAVGGAYLGPRLGRRALWLGAAVATVPDLDVLFIPLLDPVAQLTAHRTYTHNVLFLALASVLFGYLLWRLQPRAGVDFRRWTLFSALCLFTAVALDVFTSYGVPLFYPFSDYAPAIASISVIDPLYTLPLLAVVIAACWARRPRRLLLVGLAISSVYLTVTVGIKLHVESLFAAELRRQEIGHQRLFTKPTLANALLWRAVAEGDEAYWVGFHSLLDAERRVEFRRLPKGRELLAQVEDQPAVAALRLATDGFLQALPAGEGLLLRDVRYGSGTDWLPPAQDRPYVFTYRLSPSAQEWRVAPVDTRRGAGKESRSVRALWERMLGQSD